MKKTDKEELNNIFIGIKNGNECRRRTRKY